MISIKRQFSNIGKTGNTNTGNTNKRNTNTRNTNTGNTKRRAFTQQPLQKQPLIITPVKSRSSLLISQPNTPHKLKRQKAIIVEHHDIQLLKSLIMNLVKNLNLSNKTNLNNWLKIYKKKANNSSSKSLFVFCKIVRLPCPPTDLFMKLTFLDLRYSSMYSGTVQLSPLK